MNAAEKLAQCRQRFGDDYPTSLVFKGERFPLREERRFSRVFEIVEQKKSWIISRFDDGSAAMTLPELRREWPEWDEKTRKDFCRNCRYLHAQANFADLLRFIMQHGSLLECAPVALSIASHLPQAEAFAFLDQALRQSCNGGQDDFYPANNFAQALAETKHPDALPILRRRHETLWAHPNLWDDDSWGNPFALDALLSIKDLLELGAPPAEFEEPVRQLSTHVCDKNREFCRNHLVKYYPWLQEPGTTLKS